MDANVGAQAIICPVSIIVQLDLPENLFKRAEREGLLRPESIKAIIEAELARLDRRRRIESVRDVAGETMTGDEIEAEIDAVRAGRRNDANRR